jgi:hypothetical protein
VSDVAEHRAAQGRVAGPGLSDRYHGPVVFVAGVHYPVGDDGHADLSRPLRVADEDGGWRDAQMGEPLHNDRCWTFFPLEKDRGEGSPPGLDPHGRSPHPGTRIVRHSFPSNLT